MKTVAQLHDRIIDWSNLESAVDLSVRGRRTEPVVVEFLARQRSHLTEIQQELASGWPVCGLGHQFWIFDPKKRLITAPAFRERVMHHAIMRICGPVLDQRLMQHTYACRVGKGTFAALAQACDCAKKSTVFLKLDVRKYFASIPRDKLKAKLVRVFREPLVINLMTRMVFGFDPLSTHGLPIGTLISQHLANFYLAELDTHILQEIRPSGFVRYMDDLALWFPDLESAKTARSRIAAFMEEKLGLELKTAFINRTTHGMDFLGHRVFPTRLGLNARSRKRFQVKSKQLMLDWCSGKQTEAAVQEKGTALVAWTSHASCLAWRQRVVRGLAFLGDGPQVSSGCCGEATGSTTAGTADPPTATATTPQTGTTTLDSGCATAPAPIAVMEHGPLPVLPTRTDKTKTPHGWPVIRSGRSAQDQSEPWGGPFSTKPPTFPV